MKKSASEKNKTAAMRLKYIMGLKNKRDVDLINYILDNYDDLYVSAPMMSQYLKGTKHIPQNIAIAFAKYLNIDPGYILGVDGYVSSNNDYYVYKSAMDLRSRFMDMNSQTDIYDKYLSHEGCFVKSFRSNGSKKIVDIEIMDQNEKTYTVNPKVLDQYVKDIEKYYKTRTKQLLQTALKGGDADDLT